MCCGRLAEPSRPDVMSVLPVAQRELRVVARQARTYYVRTLAALAALVVVGYVGLFRGQAGFGGRGGRTLFIILTHLAAWVCVFAGARLTADTISREKREGTLGFLFLSHLSGLDVVAGKLVAHATYGFYALLAVMPVVAIPFLDGGIEAGEFWFAMLALANTLFFSVCIGLLASASSTDARRALGLATGVAACFWVVLPVIVQLATHWGAGPATTRLGQVLLWFSPASSTTAMAAVGMGTVRPWLPLICTHALGWVLLLLAAVTTRRAWRERPAGRAVASGERWRRNVVLGRPARRAARRAATLERNAFLWLLVRRRWKPLPPALFVAGVLAIFMVLAVSHAVLLGGSRGSFFSMSISAGLIAHVVLKFWIASEAAYGMTAQRREGTLELLLTTPLTVRDVVRAQFLAIWRQFGWPLGIVAAMTMGCAVLYALDAEAEGAALVLATALGATLALAADTGTLVYLGTWLGMASQKPHRAAGTTAFRVLGLPWLLLLFLGPTMLRAGLPDAPESLLVLWVFVGFGSDLLWWQYARRQLFERFRDEAERASRGAKA